MVAVGLVKGIGLAATAVGVGATLVTDWVNDKKMDQKIEDKVNEALSKKKEEEDVFDENVSYNPFRIKDI